MNAAYQRTEDPQKAACHSTANKSDFTAWHFYFVGEIHVQKDTFTISAQAFKGIR